MPTYHADSSARTPGVCTAETGRGSDNGIRSGIREHSSRIVSIRNLSVDAKGTPAGCGISACLPRSAHRRSICRFNPGCATSRPADVQIPVPAIFEALEQEHYQLFSHARQEHQSHEQELLRFQKASLQTSHGARVANLKETIAAATNDKIRIMREAELQNAETDYRRRTEDSDRAATQADILAQAVARGVINITR